MNTWDAYKVLDRYAAKMGRPKGSLSVSGGSGPGVLVELTTIGGIIDACPYHIEIPRVVPGGPPMECLTRETAFLAIRTELVSILRQWVRVRRLWIKLGDQIGRRSRLGQPTACQPKHVKTLMLQRAYADDARNDIEDRREYDPRALLWMAEQLAKEGLDRSGRAA